MSTANCYNGEFRQILIGPIIFREFIRFQEALFA